MFIIIVRFVGIFRDNIVEFYRVICIYDSCFYLEVYIDYVELYIVI